MVDLLFTLFGLLLVFNYSLETPYKLLLLLVFVYQLYQHLRVTSSCRLEFNPDQSEWFYIDHKQHQQRVESIHPVYLSAKLIALNLDLPKASGVHIIITQSCLIDGQFNQLRRAIICPQLKHPHAVR